MLAVASFARRTVVVAVAGLSAVSCSGVPETTHLEPLTIGGLDGTLLLFMGGKLQATGGGRDYDLAIDEDVRVHLHTPGAADLASYSGAKVGFVYQASTEAAEGQLTTPRALALSDDLGLVYLAVPGPNPPEVGGSQFEAIPLGDRVSLGAFTATVKYDGAEVSEARLHIATDEGTLEIEPGEAATVHLDGGLYRVVAIGAYTTDGGGCAPRSFLSYELLRVRSGTRERITRPDGEQSAGLVCNE